MTPLRGAPSCALNKIRARRGEIWTPLGRGTFILLSVFSRNILIRASKWHNMTFRSLTLGIYDFPSDQIADAEGFLLREQFLIVLEVQRKPADLQQLFDKKGHKDFISSYP